MIAISQAAQLTKNYLLTHGWTADYHNEKRLGKVCIMVAAEKSLEEIGIKHSDQFSIDFVDLLINRIGAKDNFGAFEWNDSQSSIDPIIALLDSIIMEES